VFAILIKVHLTCRWRKSGDQANLYSKVFLYTYCSYGRYRNFGY